MKKTLVPHFHFPVKRFTDFSSDYKKFTDAKHQIESHQRMYAIFFRGVFCLPLTEHMNFYSSM